MPKSTKRFTISDDRLNSHGFRMLTDGADISDFIANPIMYWMHVYPTGGKPDELLPIGFWEDIEQKDGKITAVPNFDDGDTFAMKIYGKVEHGTLRACSAGAEPKPNGLSVNPADMLPGQTLPTFTKWWLREASICDRGSNAGAVALRVNGKMVQLADDASEVINSLLLNQKSDKMKLTQLTAGGATAILAALKLNADTATEEEVTAEVGKLVTLTASQASDIHKLTAEKTDLEGKVAEVQSKLDAQVKLSNDTKIQTLVNGAADARKITKEESPLYVTLAHNHKDGFDAGYKQVEDLLEKKVGVATVQEVLKTAGEGTDELSGLVKLTYDELFENGGLVKLKALSPDHWEQKMKEKFPNRK